MTLRPAPAAAPTTLLLPEAYGLPFSAWRPGQRGAIRSVEASQTPITIVQAPTGSGKTGIAVALMRRFGGRSVGLTATRALQDQYLRTADGLVDIRGMANYPCHAAEDEFLGLFRGRRRGSVSCDEGPCRLDIQCTLKELGCAYFDQYRTALIANQVATSYAYLFASRRYGRGLGQIGLLVCDEAHDIASQIATACQLRVPRREVRGKVPGTISAWRRWAEAELERPDRSEGDVQGRLHVRTRTERLEALTRMHDGWAFDADTESGAVVFEPIDVRPLAKSLLFNASSRAVLMSATITPHTVSMLGLDPDAVTACVVPMRFPAEHRPVYVLDAGFVSYRTSPAGLRHWLATMDWVMASRSQTRGLIHTVSYARQQYIVQRSRHRDRMIAPRNSRELARVIATWASQPPNAILVSPSIMTGYDFPYDLAEWQILSKVPFPNTQSAIAQARVQRVPHYRTVHTAQQIQQATGRIVRAEDDRGETFICDNTFGAFHRRHRHQFTDHFNEVVIPTRRLPAAPPRARRMRAA